MTQATKDRFYKPIVDALATRGVWSYVEPELGGGCHALRVPFELRRRPGEKAAEAVRSVMLTLDQMDWLVVYYDDLAHGWPDDCDEVGTPLATLSMPLENVPGAWPAPPREEIARRVAFWLEGVIRDLDWVPIQDGPRPA